MGERSGGDLRRGGLLSLYQLPPEKVVAVLNGVAAANVPSAQETQRVIARYGLRQPYLFYPAAMDPHKGHLFLLQVFDRVKERAPDLRLVFSGRRSDVWGKLLLEVDRLGVAADLTHVGFVARSDVFGLMRGAVVVPFASRFEGFGLPLLEARQCGTPVVAAATTAIPEVAGSGAVLLQPDDEQSWAAAIVEILTDAATRDRLIAAGFANVTRFSWDRCARETIAVLRGSAEADCAPMS